MCGYRLKYLIAILDSRMNAATSYAFYRIYIIILWEKLNYIFS